MPLLSALIIFLTLTFWLGGYHFVHKPTPDQLYGCTLQQQAPNGECP